MNTIKAYKSELVADVNGNWIDQEKEVLNLEEVIGYSFGTNTFQVMYADSRISVYPMAQFDRVDIIPVPVEDLVPVEGATSEAVH